MTLAQTAEWGTIIAIFVSLTVAISLFKNLMKSNGSKPPEKLHLKE
jgi:ABC-type phosphate/phosphonate transport system permease subunit